MHKQLTSAPARPVRAGCHLHSRSLKEPIMLSTKANGAPKDNGASGKTDMLQALNRIAIPDLEAATSKRAPMPGLFGV
jgi:hypothetical protein